MLTTTNQDGEPIKLINNPTDLTEYALDEEDSQDYKKGGYHPVSLGDEFKGGRYKVVRKLGWGQYSTVWLTWDTKLNRHVALKVIKSAHSYTEAAHDELKFLKRVTTTLPLCDHVVTLLDSFDHQGPHGTHVCMVFEVLGENLYSLLQFYPTGLPTSLVKPIARQLLLGLKYLHRECGIIHTDIKPENILVTIPDPESFLAQGKGVKEEESGSGSESESEGRRRRDGSTTLESRPLNYLASVTKFNPSILNEKEDHLTHQLDTLTLQPDSPITVKIVDLGNACWVNRHFTDDIQTRQYRAPEVIVEGNWNATVDVWSLACLLFELITGDYLFEPQDGQKFDKDDDHLAQIMELLGPCPASIHSKGQRSSHLFLRKAQLRRIRHLTPWSLPSVLHEKYDLPLPEATLIGDFLLPMLDYSLATRGQIDKFLEHPWLKTD